jgi:hypothetical protein
LVGRGSVVALLVVNGCSSTAAPSGSVEGGTRATGTLYGQLFTAKDAIFATVPGKGFRLTGVGDILISDFADACGYEVRKCCASPGQRLIFVLGRVDANGQSLPLITGDYAMLGKGQIATDTLQAQAYYEGGCGKDNAATDVSGVLTLTSADPTQGALSGSFDVELSCSGFASCLTPALQHVAGSFQTSSCAALDLNSSPPRCQ